MVDLPSLDTTLRVGEILALLGGARGIVRSVLALRDTIIGLKGAIRDLRGDVDDHEDRLRVIEGKPMRRRSDAHQSRSHGILGV